MMYPIIGNRSRGSRVWDVDGNEYIDATMGFGIYLFGHSPDFIIDAIDDQLRQGLQVGPQSDLAGEVAALICELAGVERVTFCNSGTEAVMTALRIARAVTGRNKVVIFAGYYHGSFDGTLARPIVVDGKPRATPLAPGVMPGMVDDLLVLDYDSPESLEIIKEHAGELAAILIEPVQSRQPHVQPKRFLHELRRLTEETQTALIFDEVITGFRIHPGGAQEWFGVRADLVTYGKIVGGGMPIGVVAGSAAYMDAIDGGAWNFGDDSYPSQQKTFFAGTFCKHPLTMAAARAALSHMKARGPALQQELNERTSRFAETLNNYFEQDQTPIRIANFGSLFRFIFSKEVKFSDLFFYYLQDKGVYIWEGNTCFLSTAHNDAEIAQVIEAIKECVAEMRAGDFLPSAPARREQKELCAVPLTEAQKQLWILAQMGDDASRAYNESLSLSLRGQLQLPEMRNAIQQLIARHEALRISIGPDGEYQYIHPEITIAVPLDDFSNLADAERESLLAEWLRNEAERNFDFLNGPLVRARIAKLEERRFILAITIHHIVIDGWSVGILLGELKELYSAGVGSVPIKLGPQARFGDYVRRQEELQGCREMAEAQSYWLGQFSDSVPVLDLPSDAPRPPALTYNGSRVRYEIAPEIYRGLQRISSQQGCTLFMTMLAGFQTLLHYVTRQSDIVVGIHTAGQLTSNSENLVGYCLNVLPIRSRPDESATFAEHLASVKKKTLEAFKYQAYPFITLVKELNIPRDPARAPLISVVFNLDRAAAGLRFGDLQVDVSSNSSIFARYELFWNMVETDSQIIVECDYNIDLFAAETIRDWLGMYEAILRVVTDKPGIALTEMKEMLAEQERQRRDLQAEAFKQTRQQKLKGVRRKVIAQQS
ncbi:MAG: aminotransferase class III-fold pyridoxal phosphate-dependent enzyme [Blastocatellia bacterium]